MYRPVLAALLLAVGLMGTGAYASGLVVNELSNGTSGSREFFELLVVGDAGAPVGAVDLHGWIFDDNNGDWSGAGVASGFMRFNALAPGCAALQSVTPGSLILVYNNGSGAIPSTTKNTAITAADDLDDTNPANNIYIIPNTSACVDGYNAPAYTGPLGSTSWSRIGLRNAGDVGQSRGPGGALFHGLSFGDVGNTIVPANGLNVADGGASGTGRNYFLACGDWYDAANFSIGAANTQDTPGAVNNGGNSILRSRIEAGLFDYANPGNPQNCIAIPGALRAIPTMSPGIYGTLILLVLVVVARERRWHGT